MVYGTVGEERQRAVEWVIEKNAEERVHCEPERIRAFCAKYADFGMMFDEDRFEELMERHRQVSRATAGDS